jgi:CheY-like chemotaxis protein
MLFFVFSYLLVCFDLLFTKSAINALFIGVVFLSGAVFVLLTVIVQMKMLEAVIIHYEKSDELTDQLVDERSRVDEVLNELSSESSKLRESEIERHAIEQRLKRTERYEVLGQISSAIAHEMNNHLSPIVAFPEILLSKLPDEFEDRQLVEQMLQSALATTAIVNNLLYLSNRNPTAHGSLAISSVVDRFFDSDDFARTQQQYVASRVRWQLATDIHQISGSETSLLHLINNLVNTALETNPPGTAIHISTHNEFVESPRQLSHDTLLPGDYVVLKVVDQGAGLSPDQIESMFQPLQSSKSIERDDLIGISFVCARATVDDHGGQLDVSSEPGKGTTIAVYFPSIDTSLEDKSTGAGPSVAISASIDTPATRVLVVDDMRTQRELASSLLEHLGCSPHSVTTGEEALRELQSHDYDLVLLDMRLGDGMDGLTTLGQIKNIAPQVDVIVASGYSRNQRVREAVKLGAGFLKKPYHLERLEQALRQCSDHTLPSG